MAVSSNGEAMPGGGWVVVGTSASTELKAAEERVSLQLRQGGTHRDCSCRQGRTPRWRPPPARLFEPGGSVRYY